MKRTTYNILKQISSCSRQHMVNVVVFLISASSFQCANKSSDKAGVHDQENIVSKIEIKELNGQSIDLNDYKGKTVFINFWATWCGPCIKEMPSIVRAKGLLKDSQIEFLVASNEPVEQIESFMKKKDLNLHFVQLQNLEALGIPALPTTCIVSPAGELVFSETGYREWDENSNIELLTKIINADE